MQFDLVVTLIGALILTLGLVSRLLKRRGVPDPLLAFVLGLLLGPATGVLSPEAWREPPHLLTDVTRITLAVALMGVALGIPREYIRASWRPALLLLVLMMPAMWLAGALLFHLLLPLPFLSALLVGAVITPTDPVVASAIATGDVAEENLPGRMRHLLATESGANDGLAYTLVLLPLLLLTVPAGDALLHWATRVLLWDVAAGVVLGAAIGYAAGWLLNLAEGKRIIEEPSVLAYTLALALLTLGLVRLLGSEGLLAVFAAGVAFDHLVTARERMKEARVVEGVDRFFTLPSFMLFGVIAPIGAWVELGLRGALVVTAILLLRRLPALLLFRRWIAPVRDGTDALFLGWFGPLGVASMYYARFAADHTGSEQVWVLGSLLIAASLIAHGLTATPLTLLYGRRNHAGRR